MKYLKLLIIAFLSFSLFSCSKKEDLPTTEEEIPAEETPEPESNDTPKENELDKSYSLEAVDEGKIIFYSSEDYYRYGPSIMKNEDGSYDAWFSSPGNSGSQWDWIAYRHSDDGTDWSEEEIVMRPTPGSKDQCSVCDPAMIYFGGYYYLGYTATDYYAGNGSYNMAFVARSENSDGPFEKWNGSSWGGDPEPIIYYDGGQDNWGIGEVSFVIKDEDLFIYYTYIDVRDSYIGLFKADLCDDWPSTMRNKGPVLYRSQMDSVEVVYDETLDTFLAFSINNRMSQGSEIVMYESLNGKDFNEADSCKEMIEDYAHNMGVAKSAEGWVDSNEDLLAGYAYGKDWGRWNLKMQRLKVKYE